MSPASADGSDKSDTTGLLTRSRAEIAKILDRAMQRHAPLTADLEDGDEPIVMVTRLLRVDPDEDCIVVDYGASRPANLLLVQRRAVMFHCESGPHHVQFPALLPRQALHDGSSAIRLGFPAYLLQHPHRSHPRFRIPPELRLKCRVECPGVISFEMDVRDISSGGVGMVTHGHDLRLEPGSVLRGCLIRHPMHQPICIDMEIRHSTIAHLPDGGTTVRTGCRFVGSADEIAELVGMFSLDLDPTA